VPSVRDVVVSERLALLVCHPDGPPLDLDAVASAIARARSMPDRAVPAHEHAIRVRYDGPDLLPVATSLGMPAKDIVTLHTQGTYRVATIGFLPGFAYLRGLDPRLCIPRRSTPRPRVSALSVAIAGPYTGVYPFVSPGGWNILGTAVDFVPFDPIEGARLALGDRVRFASV
jgi:UPF0271 protein